MELKDCAKLANELMEKHGLIARGWRFEFDRALSRGGQCRHRDRAISLSRNLVPMWSDDQVRNTILHEIAHALVGAGHGHDYEWRRKALMIGCNAERTHDNAVVSPRYLATCPNCGQLPGGRQRLARGGYTHARCGATVVWRDTKARTPVGA